METTWHARIHFKIHQDYIIFILFPKILCRMISSNNWFRPKRAKDAGTLSSLKTQGVSV